MENGFMKIDVIMTEEGNGFLTVGDIEIKKLNDLDIMDMLATLNASILNGLKIPDKKALRILAKNIVIRLKEE
jgi:hypothetical protein